MTKLTERDVDRIWQLILNDAELPVIAKRFGVKTRTIRSIEKGDTWPHKVPDGYVAPDRTIKAKGN